MEVKDIAIEKVIPYARNPRRNDAAVAAVAASIREFGFRQPIVVDEDLTVLVGHTRLKAAQSLGLTKVPVHIAKGLTESQRKAYRIADNKLNDLAVWDNEMLALELVDLQNASYDLELTGFGEEEIKKLEAMANATTEGLTYPDDVPDMDTTETRTKRGDIWLLGKHRIMCGDSTDAKDVAGLMDMENCLLVVTDPPYGINNEVFRSSLPQTKGVGDRRAIQGDNNCDSVAILFQNFKCDAVIWGANNFPQLLPHKGRWICWDKRLTESADRMLGSAFELAWTSKTSGFDKMIRCLHGGVINADKGKRIHPTQKPIQVMRESMEQFSSQTVIDPFLGSGSTLIAAEQLGRTCYGMEISPQYVDVTVKRWEMFTGKTAFKLEAQT